jgi:hypothetical protein
MITAISEMSRAALIAMSIVIIAGQADAKPKYDPETIPLSRSSGYFRRAAAPDFWALVPFYAGQRTESSCSAATVTMILNAIRGSSSLTSEQKLMSEALALDLVADPAWKKAVSADGEGTSLDELGAIMQKALARIGLERATVKIVHLEKNGEEVFRELVRVLVKNEASSEDFVVANFDQGVLTGDVSVGHIAPIAAYDAESGRVLVLDPDREWFEPYWVPSKKLFEAMSKRDRFVDKGRGYLVIEVPRGAR